MQPEYPSVPPEFAASTRSGAEDQRRLADRIADLGDVVVAVQDRRSAPGPIDIGHIVVAPSGVFVVDSRRYERAWISIHRSGGFVGPMREQLMVDGRDKSTLVASMKRQAGTVRKLLRGTEFAELPVTPALCFVDSRLPMFGNLRVDGVEVKNLRTVAKLIGRRGPLGAAARGDVARLLADGMPAQAA